MAYCLTWSIYFMQIFKFSTPIEALQRDSNERSLGAHFDCLLAPLRRLLASPVADEKVKRQASHLWLPSFGWFWLTIMQLCACLSCSRLKSEFLVLHTDAKDAGAVWLSRWQAVSHWRLQAVHEKIVFSNAGFLFVCFFKKVVHCDARCRETRTWRCRHRRFVATRL